MCRWKRRLGYELEIQDVAAGRAVASSVWKRKRVEALVRTRREPRSSKSVVPSRTVTPGVVVANDPGKRERNRVGRGSAT